VEHVALLVEQNDAAQLAVKTSAQPIVDVTVSKQ